MVSEIFFDISIIIILVVVVSSIMRILKQPLIIGYIVSGMLASPYFFNLIRNPDGISPFAEMGVATLLFIVGLHLDPKVIKGVGIISILAGIGQVVFTAIIGFFVMRILGFAIIPSFYIAIALTFSSTIIITKILSDKGDIDSLYGRIAIGLLIIQDIIAILISIFISSISQEYSTGTAIDMKILQGCGVLLAIGLFSIYALPKIIKKIAKSQEFLLVFSLGWCLSLAALFEILGFSLEIGALLAGFSLAMSPYRFEISSKLKPLRDFFLIMFFIFIGSTMTFTNFSHYIVSIIIVSLFILVGNPLIVMIIMGLFGYSSRTSFFAGLTVAQISELSLILVSLGIKVGHLKADILSFVTIVGLITFTGSTYMITYSNQIYSRLSKVLSIFEKKEKKAEAHLVLQKDYPAKIILFGYNRIGYSLLKALTKMKKRYLVVDFDPFTIKNLKKKNINCVYGDADDIELLNDIKINKAEIIISTIPDKDTNMLILEETKYTNKNAIVILTARQIEEALDYYREGADYVLLPHFLGGDFTANLIERNGTNKNAYEKAKHEQIQSLKERIKEGHEHPKP